MRNKIVKNSILLCIMASVLGIFISGIIYLNSFEKTMQSQAYSQAKLISYILSNKDKQDRLQTLQEMKNHIVGRLTFVDLNGNVEFDSDYSTVNLDSHVDRKEIVEALNLGVGTAKRYSSTSGKTTYYCALKVEGAGVIRVGIHATQMIKTIVIQTLPIIILFLMAIIVLCYIVSQRITKKIVNTIETYDLENGTGTIYDELSPFVLKINRQNKIINSHLNKIKQEKEKLQQVFLNIQEAIIVCDSLQNITQYNESAQIIFNITQEKTALSQCVRNLELQKAVEKAIEGDIQKGIIQYNNKFYQYTVSPNAANKSVKGAILILLDITTQTENQNMRRQFTDNVTHELKTPLTSIMGYSQLITSGMAKDQDVQKFASIIEDNAQKLMNMIQDVIKISNLDQGGDMEKTSVELDKIWEDIIDNLSLQITNKNITLEKSITPVTVNANETAMYDIARNLISNAINYNVDGGKISIEIFKKDSFAVIKVKDTGIGIQDNQIDKIFQRFYVVDKSRNKNISSTGLGLSIVKHTVQSHKGEIDVTSKLGIGTCFTIKLPL